MRTMGKQKRHNGKSLGWRSQASVYKTVVSWNVHDFPNLQEYDKQSDLVYVVTKLLKLVLITKEKLENLQYIAIYCKLTNFLM